MAAYRVGIDVGGTFTDLICVTETGQLMLDKVPTTPDDPSEGVMNGLSQLAATLGLTVNQLCERVDTIVHGMTTADNTMIEMTGATTGLLTTEGHRDEIELRRVHKEQIWDPTYPAPPPIARRRARVPIPERLDFEGNVLKPLDEAAVRSGARRLAKLGVTSVAIVFLFSFVNPDHERRARELLLEELPDLEHVSMSHEVMPKAPEFERTSTTLVNAYVAPRITAYTRKLTERLGDAGFKGRVVIMQATGGVMPPEYVAKKAVALLGSGPTGGAIGAARVGRLSGVEDFVAVDMGGTSYDVCLVRSGQPEISTDWNWRHRYYIGLPMVDIQMVGAGGGSIARVSQGALLVGPESAGSLPGPACYGRGGERATVTDADAILGYLPLTGFAGGRMTLDLDAARRAVTTDVAEPLGLDVVGAAWAIERIVNGNMANAVRKVLSGHGADPRDLAMIAYGGGGPVHAWAQAPELNISRILVPKASPAFSALGLLVADYVVDLVRAYVTPLSQVDVERAAKLLTELELEALSELASSGLQPGEIKLSSYAQMCYQGQNFDMSVPLPEGHNITAEGLLDLTGRFHDLHEESRGFSFRNQQPLLRGVRLIAEGSTPKPPSMSDLGTTTDAGKALKTSRDVYFGDGFTTTPVYDGSQLGPGAEIDGPALIEEPFTVVVLAPGSVARLDANGTYVLSTAS